MKFNHHVSISPLAKIGKNVTIGDYTTIYDGVEIGNHSIIANNCIIGESHTEYNDKYTQPVTKIEPHLLARSHNIIEYLKS